MQADLQHCRELLREKDYPRYALSLTMPASQREKLWVLGAFNVEISRAAEMSEAAIGAVRLKWWLEALEAPREHPVVRALHHAALDRSPLVSAIEAREIELEEGYWFDDIKALDRYAAATGGFWSALTEDAEQAAWLTKLGQCWVLVGLLWTTGYHLAQGRSLLPRQVVATHGLEVLEADANDEAALCHVIEALAQRVQATLQRLSPPANAIGVRAIAYLSWRAETIHKEPQRVLQTQPYSAPLMTVWKMQFGRV